MGSIQRTRWRPTPWSSPASAQVSAKLSAAERSKFRQQAWREFDVGHAPGQGFARLPIGVDPAAPQPGIGSSADRRWPARLASTSLHFDRLTIRLQCSWAGTNLHHKHDAKLRCAVLSEPQRTADSRQPTADSRQGTGDSFTAHRAHDDHELDRAQSLVLALPSWTPTTSTRSRA